MGIRPQGALVLNHFRTVELVRKKTILGFREGETSLERAIAAEKVSAPTPAPPRPPLPHLPWVLCHIICC